MDIMDIQRMESDKLVDLFEKVVKGGRCNVDGNDRVLYQQVRIELVFRLGVHDADLREFKKRIGTD